MLIHICISNIYVMLMHICMYVCCNSDSSFVVPIKEVLLKITYNTMPFLGDGFLHTFL